MPLVARLTLFSLLCLPLVAGAAGQAVIQGENQRTYSVDFDQRNLRLEDSQRRGIYLLSRDGVLYAVSSVGNQPVVVSGNAVIGLLSGGGNRQFATGSEDIQQLLSLEPTGRSETVAGIRGEQYAVNYIDRSGRNRTENVVLSTDPDVVTLTRAVGQAAIDFQQRTGVDTQGARALLAELDKQNRGLLGFGQHYRLASLERGAPPAERFALPGAPMQLPSLNDLQGLISGMGGQR
ncbi:hypothetical protein FOZ76_07060 [Verticiella sediminum]|uniref:Uncharacterized protein n=1 Tax=Verticiella sediminum TaxID=1247510 RepID=A0A556AXC6_9BURK|nr:hypothetical protein [Verticiella sediminum]TSH97075.1 hypothetical protein FOZ76_07060 [Verticiella sediminum]